MEYSWSHHKQQWQWDRTQEAESDDASPRKKRHTFECYVEGCHNKAKNGPRSYCTKHGPSYGKLCSVEGCTNMVRRGGVCGKHGAKKKACSHEGCTNQSVKAGLCHRHGAKELVKKCSHEGCTSTACVGGVCYKHGATRPKYHCKHEGCTKQVVNNQLCVEHGARPPPKRICTVEGCTRYQINKGVCRKHGANVTIKICTRDGCTNKATRAGQLCDRHGRPVKICSVEGCKFQTRRGDLCGRHMDKAPAKCGQDESANQSKNKQNDESSTDAGPPPNFTDSQLQNAPTRIMTSAEKDALIEAQAQKITQLTHMVNIQSKEIDRLYSHQFK